MNDSTHAPGRPVLLADDDVELTEMLAEYFTDAGIETRAVHRGDDALVTANEGDCALLILDVMLPGMTGFEVLKRLRETSMLPVIMLTAKGDSSDRIIGLEMGADDYLPKPFDPRELLARTRAILRRADETPDAIASDQLTLGRLSLDRRRQRASVGDSELTITGTEFRLLERLMQSATSAVSRDELCRHALGREYQPLDRSVDTHLSNIRRKLADISGAGLEIRSIRGRGYLLSADEATDAS
ncbi:MAG: response regulator transcription factor [Pseudomonadota bacterium]